MGDFGVAAAAFVLIAATTWLILAPGGLFEMETRALKATWARPAGIPAPLPLPTQPLFGRITPTDTPPPRVTRIA